MNNDQQALRYNERKAKLSYVLSASHACEGIAKVMEYGAEKYERDNWKKGLPFTEVIDSLLRHAASWMDGEDRDEESGCLHIDHVLVNALFLSEFTRTQPNFDDRKSIPPKVDSSEVFKILSRALNETQPMQYPDDGTDTIRFKRTGQRDASATTMNAANRVDKTEMAAEWIFNSKPLDSGDKIDHD